MSKSKKSKRFKKSRKRRKSPVFVDSCSLTVSSPGGRTSFSSFHEMEEYLIRQGMEGGGVMRCSPPPPPPPQQPTQNLESEKRKAFMQGLNSASFSSRRRVHSPRPPPAPPSPRMNDNAVLLATNLVRNYLSLPGQINA